MSGWGKLKAVITELPRIPRVTVMMSGGTKAELLYRHFTKRHPRYWLIGHKVWGVGLLRLPAEFSDYLKGRSMQAVRTNRSKALAAGFHVENVQAINYLEDVCEVNASLTERQGREMAAPYFDREKVRAHCEWAGDVYAVLDQDGRLRAYANIVIAGEVAVLTRLLGHGADLDKGVMYLCLTEAVRALCESRQTTKSPVWLMYDTLVGADPGLRYFKERLGFRPYRVRWQWVGGDATSWAAMGSRP